MILDLPSVRHHYIVILFPADCLYTNIHSIELNGHIIYKMVYTARKKKSYDRWNK